MRRRSVRWSTADAEAMKKVVLEEALHEEQKKYERQQTRIAQRRYAQEDARVQAQQFALDAVANTTDPRTRIEQKQRAR